MRIPQPTHPTLKALPKLKGSYYRRIKDIPRALARKELAFDTLSPVARFLCLFFGCEKLALGIVGLDEKFAAEDAYGKGRFVVLEEVKRSAAALGMSITGDELDSLFGPSKMSARELRHKIVHDFGPSNIQNVHALCPQHIPTMEKFLRCIDEFHDYQKRTFGT
jgi:hypothetical protein